MFLAKSPVGSITYPDNGLPDRAATRTIFRNARAGTITEARFLDQGLKVQAAEVNILFAPGKDDEHLPIGNIATGITISADAPACKPRLRPPQITQNVMPVECHSVAAQRKN
jgi:hypothetical protein